MIAVLICIWFACAVSWVGFFIRDLVRLHRMTREADQRWAEMKEEHAREVAEFERLKVRVAGSQQWNRKDEWQA